MRIVDSRQFEDYVENVDIEGIANVTKSSWFLFILYSNFESVSHRCLKRLIFYINQVVPSEWSTNSNPNRTFHWCLYMPKAIIRFEFLHSFFLLFILFRSQINWISMILLFSKPTIDADPKRRTVWWIRNGDGDGFQSIKHHNAYDKKKFNFCSNIWFGFRNISKQDFRACCGQTALSSTIKC